MFLERNVSNLRISGSVATSSFNARAESWSCGESSRLAHAQINTQRCSDSYVRDPEFGPYQLNRRTGQDSGDASAAAAAASSKCELRTWKSSRWETGVSGLHETLNSGPTNSTGRQGKTKRMQLLQQQYHPPNVNGGHGNARAGKPASADNTTP